MELFKKPSKTVPPMRFDLRLADPAYDAWAIKCADLRALISKHDGEESELLYKLTHRAPNPSNGMTGRVAEMLGETVDESDPLVDGIQARLSEIASVRRDAAAALAIATERQQKARFAASKVICDGVRTEYKTRTKALADALIAAHEANAALAEITNSLEAADVAWVGHLPPAPARMLGAANDRSNKIGVWLREAAAAGLIDKKSIPEGLKQ
jgi:hypothetical protein